jgi:hypothetical protein
MSYPPSKSFVLAVLLLGTSMLAACAESHRADRRYAYNRCTDIEARIQRDRDDIDKMEAGGVHGDALRWYHDDLVDAKRDLAICRYQS